MFLDMFSVQHLINRAHNREDSEISSIASCIHLWFAFIKLDETFNIYYTSEYAEIGHFEDSEKKLFMDNKIRDESI